MPETLYKLTDENDQTYGGCQWGEGVTHTADGLGGLCTCHWIHSTTDPLLAVLLNPAQGRYDPATAHLWRCSGVVGKEDTPSRLKVGCTDATTIERIPLPVVTAEQTVRFGILCALEVYGEKKYVAWAENWLSGKDRTSGSAEAAARAAAVEAADSSWVRSSHCSAAEAAATAAWAAADAAWAAWAAAKAATAAADADVAEWAAAEAGWVAWAAVDAAATAATTAAEAATAVRPLDLIAIARRAISEEVSDG